MSDRSVHSVPESGKAVSVAVSPSLTYEVERPWFAQRRAFRTIVLLLLLNVLATSSVTWGPPLMKVWQEKRQAIEASLASNRAAAATAAAQKQSALRLAAGMKACLAFVPPPNLVVYTEDAGEAAMLAADGKSSFFTVDQNGSPPDFAIPHLPVLWGGTTELRAALTTTLNVTGTSTLFLHERRTPAGASRLVWVAVAASRRLSTDNNAGKTYVNLASDRQLRAVVIDPNIPANGDSPHELWQYELNIAQLHGASIPYPFQQKAHATPGESLRLLAGRADPNDAGTLLLDYTLDGSPGTLQLHLLDDDRLRLEADRGVVNLKAFDSSRGRAEWLPAAKE